MGFVGNLLGNVAHGLTSFIPFKDGGSVPLMPQMVAMTPAVLKPQELRIGGVVVKNKKKKPAKKKPAKRKRKAKK